MLAIDVAALLAARTAMSSEIDLVLRESAKYLPNISLARNHTLTRLESIFGARYLESEYSLEFSDSEISFRAETPAPLPRGSARYRYITARRLTPINTIVVVPDSLSEQLITSWQVTAREQAASKDLGCFGELSMAIKAFLLEVASMRAIALGDDLQVFSYETGSRDVLFSPLPLNWHHSSLPFIEAGICARSSPQFLRALILKASQREEKLCRAALRKASGSLSFALNQEMDCGLEQRFLQTVEALMGRLSFERGPLGTKVVFSEIVRGLRSLEYESKDPLWRRQIFLISEEVPRAQTVDDINAWARAHYSEVVLLQLQPRRERYSSTSLHTRIRQLRTAVTLYQIASPEDLTIAGDILLTQRSTELLF